MKIKLVPAKCPSCGADLDLNDKMKTTICKYCHSTIIVEDAIENKKIEIEGKVDVSGSEVKIDNSSKKNNLEKLAERAFNDKLYEQAYDYYNRLLELDSDNWIYEYKKGVCAAWQSTLQNFRIDETVKACKNAFNIIEVNNVKIDNKEQVSYDMAVDINSVSIAYYNLAKSHFNEFWELKDSASEYWSRLLMIIECEEYAKDLLKPYFDEKRDKAFYITLLKNLIIYISEICATRTFIAGGQKIPTYLRDEHRQPLIQKYDQFVNEIRKEEPKYMPPFLQRKGSNKGCYVATCVYGTYDCPEVWTLRRFRDYKLEKTFLGKLFIKTYYAISPKIIKKFGKNKFFIIFNKKILDRLVLKLNNQGFKNTQYNDKY